MKLHVRQIETTGTRDATTILWGDGRWGAPPAYNDTAVVAELADHEGRITTLEAAPPGGGGGGGGPLYLSRVVVGGNLVAESTTIDWASIPGATLPPLTVPPSGEVEIRASASCIAATACSLELGLHDGTTDIAGSVIRVLRDSNGSPQGRFEYAHVLTGLTPGDTLNLTLRMRRGDGAGSVYVVTGDGIWGTLIMTAQDPAVSAAAGAPAAWTPFTPTLSQGAALTLDPATSCEYLIHGSVAFVRGRIKTTTNGSGGSSIFVDLPVELAARAHGDGAGTDWQHYPVGSAEWENPGTLHSALTAFMYDARRLAFARHDGYQTAGASSDGAMNYGFDTADTLSFMLTIPLATPGAADGMSKSGQLIGETVVAVQENFSIGNGENSTAVATLDVTGDGVTPVDVEFTTYGPYIPSGATGHFNLSLWDGAIGGTEIGSCQFCINSTNTSAGGGVAKGRLDPFTGTKTVSVAFHSDTGGASTFCHQVTATKRAFLQARWR